ncbi:putative esterase [Pseudomonas sp. Os17]|uniref:alpha/beta hydrolase n=1 Tax=Pseudomonas sp. Os17 TaxID=1500686 RepID=UPI0005FCBA26|nr:dienelactone hydrolase family protein [Pseudomonas sp. Os17]BAQ77135.1 putative esterase [Pseudomonas sp. Os17]
MSLPAAVRLPLSFLCLFTALSLTSVHAEDQQDVAKGRWQGLAAMANLYLDDATPADFIEAGDNEKSQHDNYAGALAYYLTAARLDPKNAYAAYQAAGSLAAMNKNTRAAEFLDQARERGFWQWVILKEDDELQSLQQTPAYQKLLQAAEKNYPAKAKDAGLAAFSIPKGKAPAEGWPVVVWLSGFGTEGSDGIDMRADLVGEQAVLVGINGTLKRDEHQFMWQPHSVDSTQEAVSAALKKLEKQTRIDRSRIALMGFSQGAEHASHLIAEYPQQYSGALLLSPGGYRIPFGEPRARDKRIVIVHGAQEHESNQKLTATTQQALAPGNQVQSHEHAEGHTFQDDWRQAYPGYLKFALNL